jgi:GNAT superfamily N-acetyltransferase
MSVTGEVELRAFRAEDLDAVLALRKKTFTDMDVPRERRRWAWECDANPFRSDAIPDGFVLERRGAIVGTIGLLPCRVSMDGAVVSGVSPLDFAVDPELQGQGLGHLLAEAFMNPELAAFAFVTSPKPASCHLMAKYGGGVIVVGQDEPCLWVGQPGVEGGTEPPADPEIELERIHDFAPRFDALAERLQADVRLLTVRDATYLNWRYRDYPFGQPAMWAATDRGGTLRGFAVFQNEPALGHGYVTELFVAPDDAAAGLTLLRAAWMEARGCGVRELYALNRLAPVQAILRTAGFHRVDNHPLEFVFRGRPGGPGPADWYVTAGDGDLLFSVGDLRPE